MQGDSEMERGVAAVWLNMRANETRHCVPRLLLKGEEGVARTRHTRLMFADLIKGVVATEKDTAIFHLYMSVCWQLIALGGS
jgi:hypothetical protein